MQRSFDNIVVETSTDFASINPVILYNTLAVCSDSGGIKLGDGTTHWNDLDYLNGETIGSKYVQTTPSPSDKDIIEFNASTDKWEFKSRGALEDKTELSTLTTVFASLSTIIELDDTTKIPTGRFKIGDGVTRIDNIPWFGGIFVYDEFSTGETGKSIVWSGYEWVNKTVYTQDDFEFPTIPTGKFFRDDKSFASFNAITGPATVVNNNIIVYDGTSGYTIKDSGVSIDSLVSDAGCQSASFQIDIGDGPFLTNYNGNLKVVGPTYATGNIIVNEVFASYGVFATGLYIGFPTEPTSVNLTTDGTFVYVNGGKVFTDLTDGTGSGLDADTVDGKHASEFATVSAVQAANDNALIYSIVFGG